jgi:two-component sensor histidine kinase
MEVRAEALSNAQAVVSEIEQIFDGIRGTLYAIAETEEIRKANPECTNYVRPVRQKIESLTAILVVNLDGNIRCFSEPGLASPNLAERDYFRDAIQNKKFTIGTYTISQIANRDVIPLALPILRDGAIEGVIVAGLNLTWFGSQLKERGIVHGNSIVVTDRNGIIIAREPSPERFVGTQITEPNFRLISEQTAGVADVISADGVERIAGYVPPALTSFGFYVSTGTTRADVLAPVDRALRDSILLFSSGSIVALVLAWLVGEGIIRRPLMRMVGTAEAWRLGHDTVRTGIVDRDDEIGILGQTFDRLMDENAHREKLREAAEARREILVHELAHRVKNTLATVQSIASLSFRHSQGAGALRGFQDRLQALVRSHDLLTQKDWQHADLSEVAAAAMAPLKEERGHRFSIAGPPVDLPPTTAVPMAMILHELCTNALKYGALSNDEGRITIRWTTRPDERGTVIRLSWSEKGGPPVQTPGEEGFGSRLIASLTSQMNGSYDVQYHPWGLVCHIQIVTPQFEPRS